MSSRTTPIAAAVNALRPAFGATFVMSIFINLTMFMVPIYSLQIYDRVLSSRNTATLLTLTLIAALFIALYGLLEYTRRGVLVRAGVRGCRWQHARSRHFATAVTHLFCCNGLIALRGLAQTLAFGQHSRGCR